MIYKGNKKCILYHGDNHPASLFIGDKKVDGYIKKIISGKKEVSWTAPYKANLSSVIVKGEVEQHTCRGVNLLNHLYHGFAASQDNLIHIDNSSVFMWGEVKPNTKIVCSFPASIPHNRNAVFYTEQIPDKDVPWHNYRRFDATLGSFTDKVPPTAKYACFLIHFYSASDMPTDEQIINNAQMEYNSKTPYEPYCGGKPLPNPIEMVEPKFLENTSLNCTTSVDAQQAPYHSQKVDLPILRAIPGGVKDEIDVAKGIIIRRVKEFELDENIDYFGFTARPEDDTDTINQIYWESLDSLKDSHKVVCISNIAAGGILNDRGHISSVSFSWSQGLAINIPKTFFAGVTAAQAVKNGKWNQFLVDQKNKGTPVIIWYELKESIIEKYPVEKLKQLPGYTKLEQIGGLKDINLTVEAYCADTVN